MILLTVALLAMTAAGAMSYRQAQAEALFLTDKMAYELGLTESQYDAVYEINYDYMASLSVESDVFSTGWYRRNLDLSYVLTAAQYNRYCTMDYFYRPVYWSSGFRYSIYSRYADRSLFYYSRPAVYSAYRGGHSWKSNGGKSWYKGRTFASGTRMTVVNSTGSAGRSVNATRNHSGGSHAIKSTAPKRTTATPKRTTTSAGKNATATPKRGTSAGKTTATGSASRTGHSSFKGKR